MSNTLWEKVVQLRGHCVKSLSMWMSLSYFLSKLEQTRNPKRSSTKSTSLTWSFVLSLLPSIHHGFIVLIRSNYLTYKLQRFFLFWVFIKMPIVMLCSVGFSAPPYIFTNDSELRWKWIYKIMYTNLFHVHVLSQPSCNWLNWSCNKIRIWIQTL